MKKMTLHILLMTPKMDKWLKTNFHLMTPTSQVNKPMLKPKMLNHYKVYHLNHKRGP